MLTTLTRAGLPEREARVFLASLKLGRASIDKIAKEAGLQRTTTYNHVEGLMHKGLVSTVTENKRTYYMAESPEHILSYINRQQEDLESSKGEVQSLLPQLLKVANQDGKKPTVRLFAGKDGLLTMREEVLKMTGKELLVVSSYDKFRSVFTDEERLSFSKRRKRKKIKSQVIWTYSDKFKMLPEVSPEKSKRVNEKDFQFSFDVYIYDDSIAISSLETNNLWGVVMQSSAIADSMRALFAMAWLAPDK